MMASSQWNISCWPLLRTPGSYIPLSLFLSVSLSLFLPGIMSFPPQVGSLARPHHCNHISLSLSLSVSLSLSWLHLPSEAQQHQGHDAWPGQAPLHFSVFFSAFALSANHYVCQTVSSFTALTVSVSICTSLTVMFLPQVGFYAHTVAIQLRIADMVVA